MNATYLDEMKSGADAYKPRKFGPRQRRAFFLDRKRRWQGHCSGRVSDSLVILIHQACSLEWDILKLEAREVEKGRLSGHDRIALAAWRRHLREIVRQLGPRETQRPITIGELAMQDTARAATGRRGRARHGAAA